MKVQLKGIFKILKIKLVHQRLIPFAEVNSGTENKQEMARQIIQSAIQIDALKNFE